jgi:hypothetical protein
MLQKHRNGTSTFWQGAGRFSILVAVIAFGIVQMVSANTRPGRKDPTFSGRLNGASNITLKVQPDGKILVGSIYSFTVQGDNTARRLARLLPNGSLDTSFQVPSFLTGNTNALVNAIEVRPDGKIYIVGSNFSVGMGTPPSLSQIALLLPNGAVDPGFVPAPGQPQSGGEGDVAVLSDGSAVIRNTVRIFRYSDNGAIDITFPDLVNQGAKHILVNGSQDIWISKNDGIARIWGGQGGWNMAVFQDDLGFPSAGNLDIHPNGGIVYSRISTPYLIRLLANGVGFNQDTSFSATPVLTSEPRNFKIQSDGKIVYNDRSNPTDRLRRLNNGANSLDSTFSSASVNQIGDSVQLARQPDGHFLIDSAGGGGLDLARVFGGPKVITPGAFRPSNGYTYLRNSNTTGFADIEFFYGQAGDIPLAGDWNGDGKDTIGIYRNNTFYLRNSNSAGFADIQFPFGAPGDIPIVGDWDGDGIDTIGVVRGNTIFLKNTNTSGNADIQFNYGNSTDTFIVGDWNGDGIDTIGCFRPTNGYVYLRNSNTTGFAEIEFFYGTAGDKPVVGDWNGDGIDTIGIVRGNQWFLRNSNSSGFADIQFNYGDSTDIPIAGNWTGIVP